MRNEKEKKMFNIFYFKIKKKKIEKIKKIKIKQKYQNKK